MTLQHLCGRFHVGSLQKFSSFHASHQAYAFFRHVMAAQQPIWFLVFEATNIICYHALHACHNSNRWFFFSFFLSELIIHFPREKSSQSKIETNLMIPTCQYILDMKDESSMLYLSWNFKISMLKGCDNWVCTVEKMMGWVGYVGDLNSVNSICKFILDWKCNLYLFIFLMRIENVTWKRWN